MRGAGQTLNPISFFISSAVATQSQEIQDANSLFVNDNSPHILLLNPQGYAGPDFPFSARDSGGQIDYVNYEARTLAEMGYKVTVAARSFRPEEKYACYGDRKGVGFMEGTKNMVRYVFVPGILGSDAPFLPKEDIYRDLEQMAYNLWLFLRGEAESKGLNPWDASSVLFINSHYVDGGVMGQLLVRYWQNQRAALYLKERFAPILKMVEFDPISFLDNLTYNFGRAVLDAYDKAKGNGSYSETNGNGGPRLPADRAEVLSWAAKRLEWPESSIEGLLRGLHKPKKNKSFAQDAMDASSIGRRLLSEDREIEQQLKRELRLLNRHVWTPHSIGALKERRAVNSGAAQEKPAKHMEMNFPVRKLLEAILLRGGKYNPLGHLPPPARLVVETSPEIGEATFWEGRTDKKRSVQFLPGIDPEQYYPRKSVDDKGVQDMFEDLVRREVVPREIIEKLLKRPLDYDIIIEASRIDETKRKEWVIQAFALLPDEMKSRAFLFITGERNEETKEIYDPLRRQIDELGLQNNVFLVGRVPSEHMGAFSCLPQCRGSRIFRSVQFVIASRMEGWGMAAQNAAAGGLALIGSIHTPAAGYLSYKDEAAIVVSDDSPAGFSNAMQDLIKNPLYTQAMGQRSHDILQANTWRALTEDFVTVVRDRLELGGAYV